jgi:hypothetical protein
MQMWLKVGQSNMQINNAEKKKLAFAEKQVK